MTSGSQPWKGTVLMLSGWFGSRRELDRLGGLLASEGWLTVSGVRSFQSALPTGEAAGKRVLLGYSTGALPALEVARRSLPDALILVAPQGWLLHAVPSLPNRATAAAYTGPADAGSTDPFRLSQPEPARKLPTGVPVLVIQGKGDPVTRPEEVQDWLARLDGLQVVYREIRGDHDLLSGCTSSALRVAALSLDFMDSLL